jgi:hypothetical protein
MAHAAVDDTILTVNFRANHSGCMRSAAGCSDIDSMEAIGLRAGKCFPPPLACSSVARRATLGRVEGVTELGLKKVVVAENLTSYAP